MIENHVLLNNSAMTLLCQIPARHTGIASFCIQLFGLIMSAALTTHQIFHLNGITISRSIKQQSKQPEATHTTTLINVTAVCDILNKSESVLITLCILTFFFRKRKLSGEDALIPKPFHQLTYFLDRTKYSAH